MALVGFEGFDEYASTTDLMLVEGYGGGVNGIIDAVTNLGMPEGKAARLVNGNSWQVTETADGSWVIGFHWVPRQTTTSVTLLRLYEGGTSGTEHMRLVINSDHTFTISRAGSIPATSAVQTLTRDVVHFIEVYYKCADAGGEWEVRLDNTAIIGPTGSLDTRNGGTAGTPNTFQFSTSGTGSYDLDNVYWSTGGSTFLGEGRCVTDLVTADGDNTAWTASAGSDFQCVDEATMNSDTDYISSSTAAQRDSFDMATFGVTGTIRGLIVQLFARKDDAGVRQIQPSVRKSSAATDYDGSTKTLSTTYVGYRNLWVNDPSTATTWVDTDIDLFECGVENQ